MNNWRWGWEIQNCSGGPHHYLSLKFDATAAQLEQTMSPWLSQQFEPWQGQLQWKRKGSGSGCYTLIELHENGVEVTRGWGNVEAVEETLLQQLLATHLLRHWQVIAGGEGYASQHFRSGNNLASFSDYCRGAKT